MLRNSTLPARRAALTMTVTAGFCMAIGSRKGERAEDSGGKEQSGAVAVPDSLPSTPVCLLSFLPMSASARIRFVLVGTQHPGNIGAAARALKTMGLARLVLVAPEKGVDEEALRRAAGADDLLLDAPVFANL